MYILPFYSKNYVNTVNCSRLCSTLLQVGRDAGENVCEEVRDTVVLIDFQKFKNQTLLFTLTLPAYLEFIVVG